MRWAALTLIGSWTLAGQSGAPVNNALPSWLKLGAELRGRAEAPAGAGFTGGNDDGYYLHRLRLNGAIQPNHRLRLFIQAQDFQALGISRQLVPAGFVNTLDLRQAYLDIGADTGPLTLRVGRQEMAFGEGRLVGVASWGNTGRSSDAIRLTLRGSGARADLLAAALVPVKDGQFDHPRPPDGFYGVYAVFDGLISAAVLEPLLLWKSAAHTFTEAGSGGDLGMRTAGARWFGNLPRRLDYNVEMAFQTRHAGSDPIRAWAGHWALTYAALPDRPLFLLGESNYASADRDPSDGRRGTFAQLYPTNHPHFGTADRVGWRNLHDLMSGLEWKPARQWRLKFDWHNFWLADRRDAFYTEAGAVFVRNPEAAASRVGWELDFQPDGQFSERLQLGVGYAHFSPGPYLKQSGVGGRFRYPYLMWTYAS